jgi:undecaprenyl-diphosphatase
VSETPPQNAGTNAADSPPEANPTEAATGDARLADVLHELKGMDDAVYRAVERTRTPVIDAPLRDLSGLANHSVLWLAIAAALFAFGGRSGRRAAVSGVVAIGVNSFVVNVPLKAMARRARPVRDTENGTQARHVRMPTSRSFPSGHSASAFAFATAAATFMPELGLPLRGIAAVVAYSRVHIGVHYPGDVVVGSLVGMAIGESTALTAKAFLRRRA